MGSQRQNIRPNSDKVSTHPTGHGGKASCRIEKLLVKAEKHPPEQEAEAIAKYAQEHAAKYPPEKRGLQACVKRQSNPGDPPKASINPRWNQNIRQSKNKAYAREARVAKHLPNDFDQSTLGESDETKQRKAHKRK